MKIATAQRTLIPYLPVISFGLKGDNHTRFAVPRAAAISAEKPSGSCQRFLSLSRAEYGFACLDACRSVAIFQVVQLHQCQFSRSLQTFKFNYGMNSDSLFTMV